jgi:hypothetical protein
MGTIPGSSVSLVPSDYAATRLAAPRLCPHPARPDRLCSAMGRQGRCRRKRKRLGAQPGWTTPNTHAVGREVVGGGDEPQLKGLGEDGPQAPILGLVLEDRQRRTL